MRFVEPKSTVVRLEWGAKDNEVARNIFFVSSLLTASSCITASGTEVYALVFVSLVASFGLPVAAGLLGLRSRPKQREARYWLEGGALHLAFSKGTSRFALSDMRSAWIEQDRFVHVAMSAGRSVVLDAADAETAEALVTELGFAKDQRVLEMPLAGRIKTLATQRFAAFSLLPLAFVWMFSALCMGVFVHHHDGAPAIAALVGFISIFLLSFGGSLALVSDMRSRRVTVGSDGVRIPHKKRALNYADITRIENDGDGVRLVKKDGTYVILPLFRDGGFPFEGFVDARDALMKRIQAWKQHSDRTDDEAKFALLERKEQPFSEWKKQLLALSEPRGGYRVASLTAEDLERVIVDPVTTAEKRIAATVALSGLDRERARERIRVVAPTCADPQLRVALENAADHAELDEAYLEAEAESQRRRA
jgi:hypothetical protein